MSIPPGRLIVASSRNLREAQPFQARFTAGLTGAGVLASARVSRLPVGARMLRDRAAGLMVLEVAFIRMTGSFRRFGSVIAR